MAILIENVFNNGSELDDDNIFTQIWTPEANVRYLFACKSYRDSSNNPQDTNISGNSLTWTKKATIVYGPSSPGQNERVSVWEGIGASPTEGQIDINHSFTHHATAWSCEKVTGIHLTAPVVQSPTGLGNSASPAGSMSAFADAVNNALYFIISSYANTAITWEAGINQLSNRGSSSQGRLGTAWRIGQDTTPSGGAANNHWGVIAVELDFLEPEPIPMGGQLYNSQIGFMPVG